ncbi:hypothetical protein MKX01_037271 [Papaver californicum]|nr:hypothetical protein MKX01_037271 [Papaver californicum]
MNSNLVRSVIRKSLLQTGISQTRCISSTASIIRSSSENFARERSSSNYFSLNRSLSSKTESVSTTELGSASAAKVEAALVKKEEKEKNNGSVGGENKETNVVVSSFWGVSRPKVTRDDGTPWETYRADVSIDLGKHHVPKTFLDKFAYKTVKLLRIPTDVFFQRRYGCRAMMLETVAAVPGMVGGMLLHLRSLRKFQHSGDWIKALLEEAENERMHLMPMRFLVLTVQGVFFNAFFAMYLLSPKLAHRITGYLEEEAVHSYTEFLKEIDSGKIENVPAPAIAIDYWRLPKDATLKDVIIVIRADEAHHRDINHFASDIHAQGKELRDAAAPLGYH